MTDFKGKPFQLNSRETVASNGLVHEAMLNEFEQVFSGRGLEPLPDVQALQDVSRRRSRPPKNLSSRPQRSGVEGPALEYRKLLLPHAPKIHRSPDRNRP